MGNEEKLALQEEKLLMDEISEETYEKLIEKYEGGSQNEGKG